MMHPDAIIALPPLFDDDDPMLWLVSGDAIIGARSLSQLENEFERDALENIAVMLIVPASHTTFKRVEARGLEPRQELAVAKITAQEQALGMVQAAAALDPAGKIQITTIDAALLHRALDRFEDCGLTATAAVPCGALFDPGEDDIWRAEIGGHAMLCSADFCCVDEPSLAKTLFGDAKIRTLSETEIARALVAISRSRQPNFLDGMAARRNANPILSAPNRKWAKRLSILAVCLFLAGGVVYWTKLQWAISVENKAALVAAQTVDPSINDIVAAEAAVDAALSRKGIERAKPAMLVAIVWQAIKGQDNVAITDLKLANSGLLSATLSAPETASINAALLSIQRAGYQITATPRRDASGITLVDLTVKAP